MTIYLITRKWTDIDNYPLQDVDTTYGYFLTQEAVEAEVERLGDEFFWEEVEPGYVEAPKLDPLPWEKPNGVRLTVKEADTYDYPIVFNPRESYSQDREDYA